jgi:hypothetical protein
VIEISYDFDFCHSAITFLGAEVTIDPFLAERKAGHNTQTPQQRQPIMSSDNSSFVARMPYPEERAWNDE